MTSIVVLGAVAFCLWRTTYAGDCLYRITDKHGRHMSATCTDVEFHEIRTELARNEFIDYNSIAQITTPFSASFREIFTSKDMYKVTAINMVFTDQFEPALLRVDPMQDRWLSRFQHIKSVAVYSQRDVVKPYVLASLEHFCSINELHFHGFDLHEPDLDLVCKLPSLETLVLTAPPGYHRMKSPTSRKRRREKESQLTCKKGFSKPNTTHVVIRYIDGSEIEKILKSNLQEQIRNRAYRIRTMPRRPAGRSSTFIDRAILWELLDARTAAGYRLMILALHLSSKTGATNDQSHSSAGQTGPEPNPSSFRSIWRAPVATARRAREFCRGMQTRILGGFRPSKSDATDAFASVRLFYRIFDNLRKVFRLPSRRSSPRQSAASSGSPSEYNPPALKRSASASSVDAVFSSALLMPWTTNTQNSSSESEVPAPEDGTNILFAMTEYSFALIGTALGKHSFNLVLDAQPSEPFHHDSRANNGALHFGAGQRDNLRASTPDPSLVSSAISTDSGVHLAQRASGTSSTMSAVNKEKFQKAAVSVPLEKRFDPNQRRNNSSYLTLGCTIALLTAGFAILVLVVITKLALFSRFASEQEFRSQRSELMQQIDLFANARRQREGLPPLPMELADFSTMPHFSFS